ncbi:GNAT family N-acetyltransferase [Aminobacter aminovorans]|uniref:GNAT family N-acetyltransferase n=1 Tax=Aminobacter aminovorans TaxID=83263 RepID=UPI002859D197|nr:GNAT family N-acetyltransferase [Aminobacter aminovorans]MDR7222190.1 ribosomal protein S18 acetylase RimI-like enzyme [Aminobacter aminovorans]
MDKRNISVRPAKTTDFAEVKQVLADTFESTWRPEITEAAAARYLTSDVGGRYVDQNGVAFWVAEVDGQVAGMVHWSGDFIEALHVAGAYQRLGLGKLLLARAEQEIGKAGLPKVRLETDTFNQQSQAFYRAMGYVETARYPDEEWDSGLTTVLFEKPLAKG